MTVFEFMLSFEYEEFTIALVDGRKFKLRLCNYRYRESEYDYMLEEIMELRVGYVDIEQLIIYPYIFDQYDQITLLPWNMKIYPEIPTQEEVEYNDRSTAQSEE